MLKNYVDMRKILIAAFAMLLIVGMAGALPNLGPAIGFSNKGDVEIGGSLTVTGTISSGTNVTDGVFYDDIAMDGGKDFSCEVGSGELNWSLGTGTTRTTTGENYLNGNVTILANKSLTMSGTATLTGVTGTFSGTVTGEQLTSTDDATIANDLTVGGLVVAEDLNSTDDGVIADDFDVGGDLTAGTITSDAGITATTSIIAADAEISDDCNVTDDANIGGDVAITGALDVDGATTVDGFTAAEGATFSSTVGVTGLTTVSAVAVGVNATTTVDTTLTSADLETLYPIDASSASVTLTLPAADTVSGRLYMISADADMVANNIVIATTGAGKLGGSGGADTLTSTDATAVVAFISDGTNYQIVSREGTWT